MKKFLFLLFAVLSLSSFVFADDSYVPVSYTLYSVSGSSVNSFKFSFHSSLADADSVIFGYVFSRSIAFRQTSSHTMSQPTFNTSVLSTLSINSPLECVVSNSVTRYLGYGYMPKVYSLFQFCSAYYFSNPSSPVFTTNLTHVSFIPKDVFKEILFSTNTVLVSSFLTQLQNIHSEVGVNGEMISEILDALSGMVGPLRTLPFTQQLEAYAKLSGSYVGGLSPSQLQDIKDTYNSLVATDTLAASRYADSVLSGLRQASDIIGFNQAVKDFGLAANSALFDLGSEYNKGLENSVNQGFNASFSVQGATTNLLQRMTNDTAHIKQQLADGRTTITNQLERQWDGIKKTQQNTGDSAASLNSIVRNGVKIDTSNGSAVPVVIQSGSQTPVFVNIDAKDLNFLASTINEGASSLWDTWFNIWRDWNSSEQNFRNRQRDYMVNLNTYIHSNYLHTASIDRKLDFGFTNIFDLIYTQLTNNVSTNNLSALLLDDYQTFIDSSKYSSLISSLPSNLVSALSSFGFEDPSEYSGRWWVFQSANMALQSQLALTNAALSSTLLHALSAIDDSDDSGGSLLSRWLSLIDSIPDPEEIQQSLSDATNIVSNIGFERVDSLYATATQDLVSVVKGIYRDKSLPDNIRFVFIPAAHGRQEKYVDIPVGDHSSLWSLFRSGMAFALSVVTLLLFPKYVSWLVSHYTRLVERIIKSLHAYTHQ